MRIHNNTLGIGQGNYLYDYIKSIEELACNAADEMYNIIEFKNLNNKKIHNWCMTAESCATIDPLLTPDLYAEEHDILVRKMYVQYGYAVEEYVNIQIKAGILSPPAGYEITIQEIHGSTRPDFVIKQNAPSGQETVAWLDLTSQHSVDHIKNKIGTGWKNTPFVAELFYPPLNLSNISTSGNSSIAQRAYLNSAIRRQEMNHRLLIEHMVNCTNIALNELYGELSRSVNKVNTTGIAKIFQAKFNCNLICIYNYQQIVKGILVEYMTAPRNYYHATARYILLNFYPTIHSRKSAAMAYVRDSYIQKDIYAKGAELDRYFEQRQPE